MTEPIQLIAVGLLISFACGLGVLIGARVGRANTIRKVKWPVSNMRVIKRPRPKGAEVGCPPKLAKQNKKAQK